MTSWRSFRRCYLPVALIVLLLIGLMLYHPLVYTSILPGVTINHDTTVNLEGADITKQGHEMGIPPEKKSDYENPASDLSQSEQARYPESPELTDIYDARSALVKETCARTASARSKTGPGHWHTLWDMSAQAGLITCPTCKCGTSLWRSFFCTILRETGTISAGEERSNCGRLGAARPSLLAGPNWRVISRS